MWRDIYVRLEKKRGVTLSEEQRIFCPELLIIMHAWLSSFIFHTWLFSHLSLSLSLNNGHNRFVWRLAQLFNCLATWMEVAIRAFQTIDQLYTSNKQTKDWNWEWSAIENVQIGISRARNNHTFEVWFVRWRHGAKERKWLPHSGHTLLSGL